MKTNSDHRPAFPSVLWADGKAVGCTSGMTKREYFAAMALQGLLADSNIEGNPYSICDMAVKYADALVLSLNGESPAPKKEPSALDQLRAEMQVFGSTGSFQQDLSGDEPMALLAVIGSGNVEALKKVEALMTGGQLNIPD